MKLKKKLCFTIIAFIYISTHIMYAQRDKIGFENLSIEQGLSQSTVTCILQDRKGFMWFGTRGGLNQYNGREFVIYKNIFNDSTSLSDNRIHDIYEDKTGNLWIATSDGLNLFNRNTNKFIRYVHDDDNPHSLSCNVVNTVYEDLKGNLWVGTDLGGLNLLDKAKNSFIHYKSDNNDNTSLSNNTVRYIYEDRKGKLWIGTDDGQLNIFNRNNQNFKRFKLDNGSSNSIHPIFQCILEDKDGKIWLGTLNTGLLSIESYSSSHIYYKQYIHDENDNNSLANNNIMSMYIDEGDHLWIGTENNGLNIFDLKTKTFKHYKNDPNDEYSICGNSIWSLYQDPIGRVWIGTYDNGISVIDKYHEKFITYKRQSNNKNSLTHNFVSKFLEDARGNLWIATNGGGLNYFDRDAKSFINYRHIKDDKNSLPNDAVTSLCEDIDRNLWVSTWAGGISVRDKDKRIFKHYNMANGCLSSDYVQDIMGDNNGNVFIATNGGGLNVYDSKKKRFFHYTHNETDIHSLSSNFIGVLFRDKKDCIWIGTEGNGLDLLNENEFGNISFIHYAHNPKDPGTLSNNIVETIYEDSCYSLWIGTSNGLNLMNREKGTFTIFREEDGLPSNTIHGILEDSHGNLWVSTLNGISRFNPNTKTFRNYDVSDGLQGNEFNGKNAAYKSKNGEMFFGGKQGFNVFHPDSVIDNPFIPPIYITDLKIFNKSVDIGTEGSPIHKHITEMKEISLSYEQSVFSFEFVALNYTHPEKNQYAYMMEGFDKGWNYIGTKRTATYTNLDAGKYIFKVKGSNNDGVWNEEGVSLKITITPPYWQTAWFRVVGIILVFSVLVTGYKIRTARIRAHNRELGQRVSERTAQLEAANKELEAFAYSVSHDLRAPLRAIDGYINILIEDNEQSLNEESNHACAVICSETKRMGKLIDDLLSFSHISHAEIQISQIKMEELVYSVYDELTTPEKRARIEFRVAPIPPANGDPTLIHQVWMNLISNAIKFSSRQERAEIEVGYQQDGTKIIYSVRDNGAGFDMRYADKLFGVFQRLHSEKEFEGTGVGLAIVQRLIHRHGGEVWAESQVDRGTTFYFTIPQKGEVT